MKGSGLFIVSILLLASILILHSQSMRRTQQEFTELQITEAKYARLALLRNVIQKSYAKTDRLHLEAWKIAVQTSLAEEYGVDVLLNESKVTITDDSLRVKSDFYVR